MKKRSKKFLTYALVSLLVLGILGVYYFSTKQSIMGIPQAPPQEKSFTFDGVSGVAKSTYWGAISNTGDLEFQTIKEGFCGNDGDVSISNSLSDGDTFAISSKMSSNRNSCGTNGIIIETLTFPAGKLSGTCVLSATESRDEGSSARCSVGDIRFSAVFDHDCNKGQANVNANYWNANCIPSKNKNFELTFDKETTIQIALTTQTGYTGSASGSLFLNFVADPVVSETPTEEPEETEVIIPPVIPEIPTPSEVIENPGNYPVLIIAIGIILLIIILLFLKKKKRVGRK